MTAGRTLGRHLVRRITGNNMHKLFAVLICMMFVGCNNPKTKPAAGADLGHIRFNATDPIRVAGAVVGSAGSVTLETSTDNVCTLRDAAGSVLGTCKVDKGEISAVHFNQPKAAEEFALALLKEQRVMSEDYKKVNDECIAGWKQTVTEFKEYLDKTHITAKEEPLRRSQVAAPPLPHKGTVQMWRDTQGVVHAINSVGREVRSDEVLCEFDAPATLGNWVTTSQVAGKCHPVQVLGVIGEDGKVRLISF